MKADAVSRRLFLQHLGAAGAVAYSASNAHAISIAKTGWERQLHRLPPHKQGCRHAGAKNGLVA